MRRGKKIIIILRSTSEVQSPGPRFIKRLRPNHSTLEHFPSPEPYQYITKGLFTTVPLNMYHIYVSTGNQKEKKKK